MSNCGFLGPSAIANSLTPYSSTEDRLTSLLIDSGKKMSSKELFRSARQLTFPTMTRAGDKVGAFGAVIAVMGCSMCFPALAGLAGAIGMGFLSQWEGVFINTLLPIFAVLALAANALAWISHRQWLRSMFGMVGPILLLLSIFPWFLYVWSSYVTYSALALMVFVSIWDLLSPANRHCGDQCAEPALGGSNE